MPKPDEEFAGLLERDSGGFVLRCEDGQLYRLDLLRTPVDEVEKRVVVTGSLVGKNHIEANGIRLT